jgi:glycine oxidase
MRVVIVGGGVMGCATALELASRGVREVMVLERAVPGAEASSAAAGILAAQIESKDDRELDRYVPARDAYGAWAADLRERTGVDIGWRKSGALSLARTESELAAMDATVRAQRARGLAAEIVDDRGARAIERELGGALTGAAHFPDEAQVDPPQLLRALVVAIARAGVVVRGGTTVSTLVCEGGRCVGASLDGREILRADAIVLAAGSWSSLVPGVPTDVPRVRPIRGQLVQLEERPPALASIVFADHAYVVPRGDGRVVCGSTMEDVGHRREVTASGVHAILGAAIAIAPRLGQAELVKTWSNFRPQAASGEPLVGASPLAGLYLATGHHRNGILLARSTAVAVAHAITRE